MKKLKVLGVSAGAGILLFPFRKNLIANIETRGVFYTKGLEQWKLNFGGIPYYKDETLPDCKPDIIISSPFTFTITDIIFVIFNNANIAIIYKTHKYVREVIRINYI
jgi:hypothetical protein